MKKNEPENVNTVLENQEAEYWFPYHYIASSPRNGFRQHFVDTWGINYISTIEFLLEKIAVRQFTSVIDIGCGDGRFSQELASRLPIDKVCGVDYSSQAIALAKAMNPDMDGLDYVQADITADHNLGKYDAAFLMEVFEHIPPSETGVFLKSVRRLLNTDGVLHLTVPHENKTVEYKHFQHFSIDSISEYLRKDFHILEVVPFEKLGIRRRLMNYFLCNRYFILNNRYMLDLLYKWHRENLFHCASEDECQRIYVAAVARQS